MRYIHSEETLEVPENGTLPIAAAFAFPSPTERPTTTRPLRPTDDGSDIGDADDQNQSRDTPTKAPPRRNRTETKCCHAWGNTFADTLRPTVKISIKSRLVTVEGPRGKLVKDLSHVAVTFTMIKKNIIGIEIHHGNRKNVATLRTVRTLISNLIIGVTKGFKYKMRYVYAHFPINVNVDKNAETGLWNVEIRYVFPGRRRRAGCRGWEWGTEIGAWGCCGIRGQDEADSGLAVTSSARRLCATSPSRPVSTSRSPRRKRTSSSCLATPSRTCRKVRPISSRSAECATRISERLVILLAEGAHVEAVANKLDSSWTVSTSRRRATFLPRRHERHGTRVSLCFMGLTGAVARGHLAFACLVAGKTLQQNGQLSEEEPHPGRFAAE